MKIANNLIENYIQRIASEKIAGCMVWGQDQSLIGYRFSIIAHKIVNDLSDQFLVVHIDAKKIAEDRGLIIDEFYSISMIGGRKLIIIKDAGDEILSALETLVADNYFAQKSDNFILIKAGDLSKNSKVRKIFEENSSLASIACYEDSEQTIRQHVIEKLNQNQLKFDAKVIDLFLEKFDKNRQLISLEIERLAQYFQGDKNLNAQVLSEMLIDQKEFSIDQFIANFANKKFAIALNQAEKILDGKVDEIEIVRRLSGYFQKLYSSKLIIEKDLKDFERAVKMHNLFFKIEAEFRYHLKNLSLNYFIKILNDLEKIEIKIKSTEGASKLVLVSYIRNISLQNSN